jgi:hypothetical protein
MSESTVERRSTTAARSLAGPAWLAGTVFLALVVLYFVGLDQGVTSVFGSDTHVHEFMHDARHLLGFPCH